MRDGDRGECDGSKQATGGGCQRCWSGPVRQVARSGQLGIFVVERRIERQLDLVGAGVEKRTDVVGAARRGLSRDECSVDVGVGGSGEPAQVEADVVVGSEPRAWNVDGGRVDGASDGAGNLGDVAPVLELGEVEVMCCRAAR